MLEICLHKAVSERHQRQKKWDPGRCSVNKDKDQKKIFWQAACNPQGNQNRKLPEEKEFVPKQKERRNKTRLELRDL